MTRSFRLCGVAGVMQDGAGAGIVGRPVPESRAVPEGQLQNLGAASVGHLEVNQLRTGVPALLLNFE